MISVRKIQRGLKPEECATEGCTRVAKYIVGNPLGVQSAHCSRCASAIRALDREEK